MTVTLGVNERFSVGDGAMRRAMDAMRVELEQLRAEHKATLHELESERTAREFETQTRFQLQEDIRKVVAEKGRLHLQWTKQDTAARKYKYELGVATAKLGQAKADLNRASAQGPPRSAEQEKAEWQKNYIRKLEDGFAKGDLKRLQMDLGAAKQAAERAPADMSIALELAKAEIALLTEMLNQYRTKEQRWKEEKEAQPGQEEALRMTKSDYSNMVYRETIVTLVKEVSRMQNIIAVLTYQAVTTAMEHGGANPLDTADLGDAGYGPLPEPLEPEPEEPFPAAEEAQEGAPPAPSGMDQFVFEKYISLLHGEEDSAEEGEEEETEEFEERAHPQKWGKKANQKIVLCLRSIRNERRKELRREKDKLRRQRPNFCTAKHERKVKEGLDNGMRQYEVADVLQLLRDGALERRETKENCDHYYIYGLPDRGVMYCPVSDKSKIASAFAVRSDIVDGGEKTFDGPMCISTRAFMDFAKTGSMPPEVEERERERMGEPPLLLEGSDDEVHDSLVAMIDDDELDPRGKDTTSTWSPGLVFDAYKKHGRRS
eukprot:TRINITY_DN14685_c0_g4_i1.p1 TRINITY_DN14685_c0_g4~~TRINITY_DN14685_c0_g4_i1.p1  ORF type:complete len:545 (+),score=190.98 TRINITY_DN14685_c0_g4_i1:64-1698(+)